MFNRKMKRKTSPLAKLTLQQVKRIRALGPAVSQTELARRFGVSQATISNILLHKNYRCV